MGYCISNALKGISTDCSGSLGGIKQVLIALYDDDMYTISAGTDGVDAVTAIKSGVTWYQFDFRPETSNFTSTLNRSDAGGSYVTTDIALVFSRMDASKRIEMNALALDDMAVVVIDNNDEYHAFGRWLPVTASAGTGETGTAFGDSNQYTVTLHATDKDFAPMFSEDAKTAIKSQIAKD